VQRFGDGLIQNTHLHSLFLQGVYHRPVAEQPPVFVELPAPTQEQVAKVAIKVKKKVERLLVRRGKMPGEEGDPDQGDQTLWDRLCAASIDGRIATGKKTGWRVRRVGGAPVLLPPGERHLCADADGFNVHAHTSVGAGHKQELERLCRYILRPALSGRRLSVLPSGDVVFKLKRTWSDGTQALVFSPTEFLEKLAVLVPPPGRHLVTYHGVLSSAASWRKEIVPRGQGEDNKEPGESEPKLDGAQPEWEAQRPRRLAWAALLARTFGLDVLRCEKCGGRMKIVAAVMDPEQIVRLCNHLGEPAQAPVVAPSRYQVQTQWDFGDTPAGGPEVPAGEPAAQPQRWWDEGDWAPVQGDYVDPPAPPD
jgi:Putative transposase